MASPIMDRHSTQPGARVCIRRLRRSGSSCRTLTRWDTWGRRLLANGARCLQRRRPVVSGGRRPGRDGGVLFARKRLPVVVSVRAVAGDHNARVFSAQGIGRRGDAKIYIGAFIRTQDQLGTVLNRNPTRKTVPRIALTSRQKLLLPVISTG